MDKILFICEGDKTEKKFCNLIIDKYFIQNNREKEYVAFGTNIYGLYDEMSQDEGLDVVELIKEKAKKKKDMYNYSKLEKGGFSEIYLIFDYDFQAPQYDDKKIQAMLEFFDNETEHGKLYINYPMIESFKHFKSLPDFEYNSYTISKKECSTYKQYINRISKIAHFNDVDEQTLGIIIKQNLDKLYIVTNTSKKDYLSYIENLSQKNILKYQIKSLHEHNYIYVINTIVFWGIDYFGKSKYDEYISINLTSKTFVN